VQYPARLRCEQRLCKASQLARGRDLENGAGRMVGPTAAGRPVEVSFGALDEPSIERLPVGAGPLTADFRAEPVDRRQTAGVAVS
jgi:hypothetical protein